MVRQIRLTKNQGGIDLSKGSGIDLRKTPSPGGAATAPRRNNNNSSFELPGEPVEPQPGMVPIWNTPFYMTPGNPVSPTDCDRWSNSIYCAMPSITPPTEVGIDLVLDECNIGVQLSPVIAFISLPEFQLVYRNPNCIVPPPPPPFEPPPGDYSLPPYVPPTNCANSTEGSIVIVWEDSSSEHYQYFSAETKSTGTATSIFKASLESFEFPVTTNETKEVILFTNSGYRIINAPIVCKVKFKCKSHFTADKNYTQEVLDLPDSEGHEYQQEGIREFSLTEYDESFAFTVRSDSSFGGGAYLWKNEYSTALEQFKTRWRNSRVTTENIGTDFRDRQTVEKHYTVEIKCGAATKPKRKNPPPPPPKKRCCMGCCPSTQNNDQLLQILLAKVKELDNKVGKFPMQVPIYDKDETEQNVQPVTLSVGSLADAVKLATIRIEVANKLIGIEEYPASLPASLISKDEGWLGNLIPNPNVSVPNLTRLFSWYIERFDELMGQFEIPIEVKDADPTKPGDQPVGFKLPNVAEAIAELFGLVLQTSINSETLVNMLTRNLIETGQDKQQNFKSFMMLQALVEYMGFEHKEHKIKMPMLFTPGKEKLEELLTETEIDVAVTEYNDKIDLRGNLNDLLQAAAIIRAVHWRKLDPNNDMKDQIVNLIKGFASVSDIVGNKKKDADGKSDFDRFMEDAETGFTNQPGITDTEHPYGRNYSERPKIREIGTDTSET